MGLSKWQQLDAFAYWRRRITATDTGKQIWGLKTAVEARLMNQAPIYILPHTEIDLYAEAPLLGTTQIDLSAQYTARDFLTPNLQTDQRITLESDFFHYYAAQLAQRKPSLLDTCHVYLEADILENEERQVASFINLSGDFVQSLLDPVLRYRERIQQIAPVRKLLQHMQPDAVLWHMGFMESRQERPLRLVLIVPQGLAGIQQLLQRIGIAPLPEEGWQLLQHIDALGMFQYMLDIDVLSDGEVGQMVGIELLPREAAWPAWQILQMKTAAYASFVRLLQDAAVADTRLNGLPAAVFAAGIASDVYMYSRISHFKLRWHAGHILPAKVYVQLRSLKRQCCLNEALGYIKTVAKIEDMEGVQHEQQEKRSIK